jgi:aminoacylase
MSHSLNLLNLSDFQKYIQIRTVHPAPDYTTAIDFLVSIADRYSLNHWVIDLTNGRQALLISYNYDESKPSVLFNSHMDVVPVNEELWDHDPFSATIDINEDRMYGRGTQDMKTIGMQYLHALIRLSKQEPKQQLNHNILLSFVPDEEISSVNGMHVLIHKIKKYNIKFAFDEGIPNPDNTLRLYHSERKMWWVKIIATGEAGHGSRYVKDNAMSKLSMVINRFLEYAETQKEKPIKDMVTINVNYAHGGDPYMYNVIPSTVECGIDIRVPLSIDLEAFGKQIEDWCNVDGITHEFIHDTDKDKYTKAETDPNDSICQSLNAILTELDIKYQYEVFPASTDAGILRNNGIPTIGMSLMFNTENRLHDNNEYVRIMDIESGVNTYYNIFLKL